MAQSVKRVTNRIAQIQSKAQESVIENSQKVASSTEATQSGATTTPVVTETPKINSLRKAQPSATTTTVTHTTTPTVTPVLQEAINKVEPTNLLGSASLRKAATPDLLSTQAEEKDIKNTTIPLDIIRTSINVGGQVAKAVSNNLYEQGLDWINDKLGKLEDTRQDINKTVGSFAIDMFKGVGQDISNQWTGGEGIGMVRDTIANTIEGLPRGITRAEYGIAELLDWGIDADRLTKAKENIKSNLDYWENTRVYKKVKETESFKDFLKNPTMYAGGTLTEMLPMFISKWVAIPTTFAQIYAETYLDYSQDESLGLNDNQTKLLSTGVASVNTIIELASDLVEGIMPWTRPTVKATEKEIRKRLSKPFSNLIKKFVKRGASEGIEEVSQNEIQTQVAIGMGSDRPAPTWYERFTIGGISSIIGGMLGGGDIMIDINQHRELKTAFDEWSEAVDNIAPGVSKSDKEKLFSAIVAAEIQDANMSEKRVNKYETQVTELYNQIEELNKQLETTTDENEKFEINRKIETATKKINDIDEIINSANKVTEEVNAKLQELSQQEEEKAIEKMHTEINNQVPEIKNNKNILYHVTKNNNLTKFEDLNKLREYESKIEEINERIKNAPSSLSKEYQDAWQEKMDLIKNIPEGMDVLEQIGKNGNRGGEGIYLTSRPYEWSMTLRDQGIDLGDNVYAIYLPEGVEEYMQTAGNDILLPEAIIDGTKAIVLGKVDIEEGDIEYQANKLLEKYTKDKVPEAGGENLSKQTMKEIAEEKAEDVKIPNSPEGYKSLSEALKQPGNTYLTNLSDAQLRNLKKDVQYTWKSEGFYSLNNKSYRYLVKAINAELEQRRGQETISSTKKLKFKNAQDFVNKMIAIDKKNGDWSESADRDLREKYFGWFLRNNIEGDFSAHLPGLKGINLKQIEKKLTDKNLRDIAEMIALVSKTFGIDFNKVITDSNISVNIVDNQKKFLYNTKNYGLMDWMPTKEQVLDLIKRTGHGNMGLAGDIIKMGVAITLDRGPEWSGSTMAHELMHLLDFAISTEEGLPLKYDNGTDYTSSIEGDYDWKTFKVGTYRPNYYNRWTEILARYAQQYYSWKNHPDVFKEYCKRDWYWTEGEFLKLVPKFEQFIKDRLGTKLLDEENQFYYDIVRKLNENKFASISTEFDTEGLSEMDIKQKLNQIEEEYAFILGHLNEMTGTLKEEMEAYVQLSNLQQNYEMAKAKGEEYLKMLETTPEQQSGIDAITSTVLPPVETPTNPNPEPPQNPETINNGLPQLGGSNIENGLGQIAEGNQQGPATLSRSYMSESAIAAANKKNKKIKTFRKELGQAWHDVITPAISRIYNISPRVAGRLITMEAQTDINIHRYREKAKGFVETLGGLKGKKNAAKLFEIKKALLDYGALASEQTEDTIEDYKREEVRKLREILLRNGFKEKDINDMFFVLDDIGRQYKEAGLSVTLSDMYFPRVVKDYEGLINYMSRVSGQDIALNKRTLLNRIREIQNSDKSDAEKEALIRRAITTDFTQPGTTSQHGKERKLGLLSDWGDGIYAYYESPIESIDHYITTMTNAIQRQLFLGGMKEDSNYEGDILNQSTSESISAIIDNLVENGMINEDNIEELKHTVLSVLNKKRSPSAVTSMKNLTYSLTITNFLSAINQLDDLGMTILKDKSGFKNIVKTIFKKANIKYDELGLDDAYEMFREEGKITNWLFSKSFFNMFDRLGKTSFVNAAWESMIHQSKNEKTRKYLYTRLESMYGKESADRMMEKIDKGDYMVDGQIDIEILRDLLYQLGSTQPIFTSAMPTAYLNHPWVRMCYALSSFTLKRIDWLLQGAKEVNKQHGPVVAGAWLMGVSFYLALFGAIIGDIGDFLKGEKEETFLWNLLNNGIEDALKAGLSDALSSWLKIWDLSDYDLKIFKQQGLKGLLLSKISPAIFDIGTDFIQAIREHDKDEITDLAKYVPIFGKLVYYWCWDELESVTKSEEERDFSGEEEWDFSGEEEWDFSGEEEWDFS